MKGLGFYGKEFLVIKSDFDLIAESITRIVMTNFNERVGRPRFGANLKNYVFEQMVPESLGEIETNIKKQISTFEPRANLKTIILTPKGNTVNIQLGFTLVGGNVQDERFINLTFQLES